GRKAHDASGAQANRGRSVGLPGVGRIPWSASLAAFLEKNRLAVGGHVAQDRPVEPGELARPVRAGRKSVDARARLLLREKDAPVPGDVLDRQAARSLRE